MIDAGVAMALIAVVSVVAAMWMVWKAKKSSVRTEGEMHLRHAVVAAVIGGIAAFLFYRRRNVMENVASQYLISGDF